MREPVFLLAFAMLFGTAIVIVKTIAGAIAGRGASRSEIAQLKEQLEQNAAAVEDAHAALAQQSTQITELQERVDFAERLLAQSRDRTALGPGENRV